MPAECAAGLDRDRSSHQLPLDGRVQKRGEAAMGRARDYVLSVGIGVCMLGGIIVASRIFPAWEGYFQFVVGVLMGVAASAILYIAIHYIEAK